MSSRIESATTFDQIAGVKHGIRFDNPRLIEFFFTFLIQYYIRE